MLVLYQPLRIEDIVIERNSNKNNQIDIHNCY